MPGKKWGKCIHCGMEWKKCWKLNRVCCGRCKHAHNDNKKLPKDPWAP